MLIAFLNTKAFAQTTIIKTDSICLEPLAMDYFLVQDAKADILQKQLNDCRADNTNLLAGIEEKKNQIIAKDTLISVANQETSLKNDELTIEKQTTKALGKTITKLRFALFSTIGGFVTYVTYRVFKPDKII